ncbi:hypothetical protein CHS0354_019314 [Potamilus streckersoni]|uniref:F-box domain-containing protein n=1 Tax=Potamilus streckersoni TaxID=2493646 RepID=A0AAE0SIG7_9BIVA|nr:hypothetical protein CHS0354_019314 [Potamilus streckersoni]
MSFHSHYWPSYGDEWVRSHEGWRRMADVGGEVLRLNQTENEPTRIIRTNNATASDKQNIPQTCIYIRGRAKERQISTCLSDALNIFEIKQSASDIRRSNYVCEILRILLKEHICKLSGTAQRIIFQTVETLVNIALSSEMNLLAIKNFLDEITHSIITSSGTGLIGSPGVWKRHLQMVTNLATKVSAHKYTENTGKPQLLDLPKECLYNIISRLTDHRDIIMLGSANSYLYELTCDPFIWEKLCYYHFTEKQMMKYIDVTDDESHHWLSLYRKCSRKYGLRREYTDMLVMCIGCHALHWKLQGHNCISDEDSVVEKIEPMDFVSLFHL